MVKETITKTAGLIRRFDAGTRPGHADSGVVRHWLVARVSRGRCYQTKRQPVQISTTLAHGRAASQRCEYRANGWTYKVPFNNNRKEPGEKYQEDLIIA
jgi:hypothetical protein